MRRTPELRQQFAATVGKRLLSERLISSSRANMMEHHRSAQWAEREYLAMLALMKSDGARIFTSKLPVLMKAIETNDFSNSLINDYTQLLTRNHPSEEAEKIMQKLHNGTKNYGHQTRYEAIRDLNNYRAQAQFSDKKQMGVLDLLASITRLLRAH